MTPLFKKLNYKNQSKIFVLNAPVSFNNEIEIMQEHCSVHTSFSSSDSIEFILVFVTQREEINQFAKKINNQKSGDAIIWFCYPKGSSKLYSCDFNRDSGWDSLQNLGFEPVRQVAIDEDWSALRFRHRDYIKTMTRNSSKTKP